MDKPQADSIEGIPPAIAIEQANHVKTTRSTVGTITEINDYLKLLMPRLAGATCPDCSRPVRPESPRTIADAIVAGLGGKSALITFPVATGEKTRSAPDFFSFLNAQGYLRVWIDGAILRTDEAPEIKRLPARVLVIQDRVDSAAGRTRLLEAIETALRFGKDRLVAIETETGAQHPFSSGWHCAHCDLDLRPPSPGLFSFNNPLGACPACRGFGRTIGIDYDKVIPDRTLSLAAGAIRPFQGAQSKECQRDLLRHAAGRDVDVHAAFDDLPAADQRWVIDGEGGVDAPVEDLWENGRWYGVKGFFRWLETKTYKMHVRVLLSRYRSSVPCASCNGGRYQPETLNFRLPLIAGGEGWTLPGIMAHPVGELARLFTEMPIPPNDASASMLRAQIASRLRFLDEVGLGYLSLDRATKTLSGGEIERVSLTTCLGASLVNTLFVMDEPSVGLHPRDTGRLIRVMRALRDKGNTLIVVEHEEAVIRAADHLVDIGPGRGASGGTVTFSGPLAELGAAGDSLTGDYLFGRKSIPVPAKRRKPKRFLELLGVRHHNLDGVDVRVPLGVLCCVTGVSGSGKSSLVSDVLYGQLMATPSDDAESAGNVRAVRGDSHVEDVVRVDQSPLARTPRSTPAVYLGVFDAIRDLFGMSDESIGAGLTPGSFSFNSGNGRCERCAGLGYEKVEMQFLSDLFLRCPECEGKRYQPQILKILVGGKSIHDVLELTVAEAIAFFEARKGGKKILDPLRLMAEVGLDYLKLGQPVNLLSGGESQRLKLVRHLAHRTGGGTMLILDEPTTGLHLDDIAQLLSVFQRLVEGGDSLVVIEHNVEVIKSADWLLDLGPEAGQYGGHIVAQGTPEQVAAVAASHTGRYLARALGLRQEGDPPEDDLPPAPSLPIADGPRVIAVRGAREHNLKNISLDIPRDCMVVITGLSGSGKSTLAFDLLFAEGQRRFLDSMSPYARQFVDQLEKPDVDRIDGLPPSVAIEQRVTRGGGKSTVATVTEVYHFLRLLFAKLGTQYCPRCDLPVEKQTVASCASRVEKLLKRGPVKLFAPLVKARKGFHTEVAHWAANHGFEHLLVDGSMVAVEDFKKLERFKEHSIDVLVAELSGDGAGKIPEVVRQALAIGKGTARARDAAKKFHVLSTEMNCPGCGQAFEELDPRLFSFNSPHGCCATCRGFGEVWRVATKADFESPIEAELAEERSHESVEEGEAEICPECRGARINEIARAVRLGDIGVADFVAQPAGRAKKLLSAMRFTGSRAEIARDIVAEIGQRLSFLGLVGLDYLSLDRSARTLSGGESQRIRLAAQLGSNLRGVLYVLDEPTIGLHPRDNERLLEALSALKGNGNSLVIVEHDEETMRRADRIIDLGPGAGRQGGEILANGTLAEIIDTPRSLTARYLREPLKHPIRGSRRSPDDAPGWIELRGARMHNLKNLDIRVPLNRLTVFTGISGSGKSTLLRGCLLPAVQASLSRSKRARGATSEDWDSIAGAESLGAVIEVDQTPIGKTSRSTPGTYIKVLDHIRELFAQTPAARMRGYSASRFSFNNEGGRCETCQGQGAIKLEMTFLPASYMPCEDCGGKRYNAQTLEIEYDGRSIGDVMAMTAAQAAELFGAHPKIRRSLELLVETGLGYLPLGQPSPTLSGGEAQRIKLVTQLSRRASATAEKIRTSRVGKSTLTILEEPTIGLHTADVINLISVLHRLVDEGGTVVVIEHHLDLIAEADYVIDIGPEAGAAGGEVMAAGTPEEVAKSKKSRTAPFLREVLARK